MKKLLLLALAVYCLLVGSACLIDLGLVLSGHIRPVSGAGIIPDWFDSPIIGYNVNPIANTAIGFIACLGIFEGCFLLRMYKDRKPKQFRPNVDFNSSKTRRLLKTLASQDRPE